MDTTRVHEDGVDGFLGGWGGGNKSCCLFSWVLPLHLFWSLAASS